MQEWTVSTAFAAANAPDGNAAAATAHPAKTHSASRRSARIQLDSSLDNKRRPPPNAAVVIKQAGSHYPSAHQERQGLLQSGKF
jgi:hypothetical protein